MQPLTGPLLTTITHRLVSQFQPEQVILFGSYAWGEPTVDSDVDLFEQALAVAEGIYEVVLSLIPLL